VEQEGVRRALQRAAAADLVLWVTDASAAGTAPEDYSENFFLNQMFGLLETKSDLLVDKLWINCESPIRYLE
jgi:tRNA U34 5-carboxymethylaminomethyl modifying GTPase MnmE/TrmE